MGPGRWFRSIICLKRSKEDKSKQSKVHSAAEKSNGVKPVESNSLSAIAAASSSNNSRISIEEAAAIRIQNAFRAFMARRILYRLKGAVRFNLLIQGHTVKNQTSAILRVMHSWCDLQNQIRARRLCMVTQGRLKQKKLENQLKLEAKLHELEVEWCGGSETMEEILARIQQKEEAAVKRERAMAYAFSHQWRANPTQYLGQATFSHGKENWAWSWKERWIAARPWEVRVQSQTSKSKKGHTKPISKPEKFTKSTEPKLTETSTKSALPNGKEAAKFRKGASSPLYD